MCIRPRLVAHIIVGLPTPTSGCPHWRAAAYTCIWLANIVVDRHMLVFGAYNCDGLPTLSIVAPLACPCCHGASYAHIWLPTSSCCVIGRENEPWLSLWLIFVTYCLLPTSPLLPPSLCVLIHQMRKQPAHIPGERGGAPSGLEVHGGSEVRQEGEGESGGWSQHQLLMRLMSDSNSAHTHNNHAWS